MQITLTLPLPDRGLLPNTVCHWAKKARLKKAAREAAKRAMFVAMQQIEAEVWVLKGYILNAFFKTKRHWDDDSVGGAFKAGRDGIADAIMQDDRNFKCLGTHTFTDSKNPRLEIVLDIVELV